MSTLTLTKTSGGVAISLTGNLVYGTDYYPVRLNQFLSETADGGRIAYDGGPTRIYGKMVIKNVSYTDGVALKAWISDTIIYNMYDFTVSAITGLDFGKGKGVAITLVSWEGGTSLEKWFTYVAPGLYEVTIPYSFLKV